MGDMNLNVLSILTGKTVTDPAQVIKQGWHGGPPYMTGCLINTDNVFSICHGIVIGVGKYEKDGLYSITVEYNYLTWVRYCLLDTYNVSVGDTVELHTKIGTAHNGVIRFEYCTSKKSDFSVRNLSRQLYKQDPTPVLFGQELLSEVF